jgi:hypothetical protein
VKSEAAGSGTGRSGARRARLGDVLNAAAQNFDSCRPRLLGMPERRLHFAADEEYLEVETAARLRSLRSPPRPTSACVPSGTRALAATTSPGRGRRSQATWAGTSGSKAAENRPKGLWTAGSREERVVGAVAPKGESRLSSWAPVRRWPVRPRPRHSRIHISFAAGDGRSPCFLGSSVIEPCGCPSGQEPSQKDSAERKRCCDEV